MAAITITTTNPTARARSASLLLALSRGNPEEFAVVSKVQGIAAQKAQHIQIYVSILSSA